MPDNYISDCELLRMNQDVRPLNNRGKDIIELCKSTGLRIVNGRKLGDITGNFTCYERNSLTPSLIDYALAEAELFGDISFFCVKPLTEFSNHCPIEIKIDADYKYDNDITTKENVTLRPQPKRYQWESGISSVLYQRVLSSEICYRDINILKDKCYGLNSQGTNLAVKDITGLILNAADHAQIKCKRYFLKKKSKKKKCKIWNPDCMDLAKQVKLLCRQVNKSPFDRELRIKYYSVKKHLKKSIKKNSIEIRNHLINQLDRLYDTDPKEYWTLINELEELHNDKNQSCESISPDKWLTHFKNLMSCDLKLEQIHHDILQELVNKDKNIFSKLDFKITEREVLECIKKLKKNKSPGSDSVTNEMLIAGKMVFSPLFANLFNHVLLSGCFPDSWAVSYIKPLFKGGSIYDPSDYRGISLSSCLGKLFCSVLNKRLVNFLQENNMYKPNQTAFREGCRTSDHIFVLKTLIDKYVKNIISRTKASRLYVCFVDLRKAFDTVWREGLLYKLLNLGVGGSFFKIIESMYSNCKVSIKLNDGITQEFDTNIGVKQGCVISPTLFNIFLNDIPDIFENEMSAPVDINGILINCLMYADDIALISQTAEGLQHCLHQLGQYCNKWKLSVNTKKTKVVVFTKTGRIPHDVEFYMNGEKLEIVKEMKYLGIVFHSNCLFTTAIENLKGKSNKALFKLTKSFGNFTPSVKTSTHLFDSVVKPVLLYNSEIWGSYITDVDKLCNISTNKTKIYHNFNFEKLHLRWCKYTLGVNSKSSNIAVLAELGRYPLAIEIFTNMIKYWLRVKHLDKSSFAYNCYIENSNMVKSDKSCWLTNVYKILSTCNMSHLMEGSQYYEDFQDVELVHKLRKIHHKKVIKHCIVEMRKIYSGQFCMDLFNDYRLNDDGNKLRTYRTFKNDMYLEKYLINIRDRDLRKYFCRLRISAHNLPIEKGRHRRPKKTPIQDRVCDLCNSGEIGNEMHLVNQCISLKTERDICFDKIKSRDASFENMNNNEKFIYIMKCSSPELAFDIIPLIKCIIQKRGGL